VSTLAPVMKCGVQQRYDLEGIAIDTSIDAPEIPGFWLASEGNATYGKPSYRPNLLVQVGADGEVMQEVALPTETDSADGGWIRKNGFEGVTVSSNGRYLLAAIQRGYADDTNADNYTRISRYDLVTETWDFFLYPLAESNLEGDWIGLSEIVNLDWDRYAVVERDKQIGGAIRLKSVYTFTLDGLNPFDGLLTSTSDVAGSVISKQELVDLRDLFSPFEKVEGLAVTRNGVLWAELDNDGGEVESVLCAAGLVPDLVQKLNR